MNPARLAFYGGIAIALAVAITLVNALPSVFDVLTLTVWTIGGVIVGRRSVDWF